MKSDKNETQLINYLSIVDINNLAYISMRKYNGGSIDNKTRVTKLENKCSDSLSVQAHSVCDTVSYPYGKWKVSAVNLMLRFDLDLSVFADSNSEESQWMDSSGNLIYFLYSKCSFHDSESSRCVQHLQARALQILVDERS